MNRETGTGMYYQVTCLLLTDPQLRSAIASKELLSETECIGIVNDLRASPPTPEPENLDEKCKVGVKQDGCHRCPVSMEHRDQCQIIKVTLLTRLNFAEKHGGRVPRARTLNGNVIMNNTFNHLKKKNYIHKMKQDHF